MDRSLAGPMAPMGTPRIADVTAHAASRKPSSASRLFGYDIFLSFALGPPPRGTHSYASDLARRLRERDFNVFFSEDEAPPGQQLDSTLRSALLRSKTLVVIANRGTLRDPRWVRKEVEEFRKHRSIRPVIIINVGGALHDSQLPTTVQDWLGYEGKIWIDESEDAVASGIASDAVVARLATAPTWAMANAKWRWIVRGVVLSLTVLTVAAGTAAWIAYVNEGLALSRLRNLYMDQARTQWLAGNGLEAAHLAAKALDLPRRPRGRESELLINYVERATDGLQLRARATPRVRMAGARPIGPGEVLTYGPDGIYLIRKAGTPTRISTTVGRVEWVDGEIAAVQEDNAILFLRLATGDVLKRVDGKYPRSSKSGKRVVVKAGGFMQVLELPGMIEVSPRIPVPIQSSATLHLDGEYLTLSQGKLNEGSRLWSSSDGYARAVQRPDLGIAPKFSRDLNLAVGLITTSQGRFAIVADVSGKGGVIERQHGPDQSMPFDLLQEAEISAPARRIATRSRTRARLWSLEGAPIGGLLRHEDGLVGMLFVADGRQLATWGRDRKLRLWDSGNGSLLTERSFDGVIQKVTSNRAGSLLLVTTSSRETYLLDATLRTLGTRIIATDDAYFIDGENTILTYTKSGDLTWRTYRQTANQADVDGTLPIFTAPRGESLLAAATVEGVSLMELPTLRMLRQRAFEENFPPLEISATRSSVGVVRKNSVQVIPFDASASAYTFADTTDLPLGQLLGDGRTVSFAPRWYSKGWLLWNNENVEILDGNSWAPVTAFNFTKLPPPLKPAPGARDNEHFKALVQGAERILHRLGGVELSLNGKLGLAWSSKEIAIWDPSPQISKAIARLAASIKFACLVGNEDKLVALVEPRRVALVDARRLNILKEWELTGNAGSVVAGAHCRKIVIIEEPESLARKGDARVAHIITVSEPALAIRTIRHEEQIRGAGVAGPYFHLFWGRHVFLYRTESPIPFDLVHDNDVVGATFSDDGKVLLSWDKAGELRAWDTRTGWLVTAPFMLGASLQWSAICTVNGAKYVIAASSDGRVISWLLAAPTSGSRESYVDLVEHSTGTILKEGGRLQLATFEQQ